MSDQTPNLRLPYLQASQAAKHVTINDCLRLLDCLVQAVAVSSTRTDEPVSPVEASLYVLPPGRTGVHWSTAPAGHLARFIDGGWQFIEPRIGWQVAVVDPMSILMWDGSGWARLGSEHVRRDGDTMSGPLQLPSAGLTVGSSQLAVTAVGVGIGTAAPVRLLTLSSPSNPEIALQDGSRPAGTRNYRMYYTAGSLFLGTLDAAGSQGSNHLIINGSSSAVWPGSDNAFSLGGADFRWANIYCASGVIQTSDAREKQDIQTCPLGLEFIRSIRPVGFRRRADGRIHTGFVAQDVSGAVPAGLDWAGWTLAEPGNPDSRQGLRLDYLIAPLVQAVQELDRRLLSCTTLDDG